MLGGRRLSALATRIRSFSRRRSKAPDGTPDPETLNDAAIAAMLVENEREQLDSRCQSNARFREPRGLETSANDEAIAAALTEATEEASAIRRESRSTNPETPDELDMEAISALLSSMGDFSDETVDASSRQPDTAEGGNSWFDGWFEGNWIAENWLGSWFDSAPVPPELACVACLDKRADACIIPCGHINICMGCSERLPHPKRCPMCRIRVDHIVKAGQRSQTDTGERGRDFFSDFGR
mmetsp:Transcript_109368/g.172372  ORF Transcript_109368/g.172372 Transcript_109368/m.172372 type:complete len:240 (+) Transcript_109368:94-813(+)